MKFAERTIAATVMVTTTFGYYFSFQLGLVVILADIL